MKLHSSYRSIAYITALALGLVASTALVDPDLNASVAAPTDSRFPDTQGYWGQPFIRALAERNIVTGYLDNTYRPERPVARDEFAAVLRQAFSQPAERQISSGSAYEDVPDGYWAAPAIRSAYEMGFMQGYPDETFRPDASISKTEVLSSLAENLDLPAPASALARQAVPPAVAPTPAPDPVATAPQSVNRRRARRPLLFPLAMTSLMQPVVMAAKPVTNAVNPAQAPSAQAPSGQPQAEPATQPSPPTGSATVQESAQPSATEVLSEYYDDAAQIPQDAADGVARATEAGIVVNYPDPRLLNPNQPATRGEVAALIHQALVHQGRIAPLPENEAVTNYIVGR